jgi:hypothetical protein
MSDIPRLYLTTKITKSYEYIHYKFHINGYIISSSSRGSVWQKRQKEKKYDKQLPDTRLQNSSDLLMMLFSLSMTLS